MAEKGAYVNMKVDEAQMLSNIEIYFRHLSEKLGANWEPLATHLNFLNDEITMIKRNSNTTEEQIFDMFMEWNHKNDLRKESTQQVLLTALCKIGRQDLTRGQFDNQHDKPMSSISRPTVTDDIAEDELRSLSSSLAAKWKQLATHLGIPWEQVSKIERDYRGVEEQTFQMLMKWKKGQSNNDPRGFLCNALRKIGRTDLAESFSGTK